MINFFTKGRKTEDVKVDFSSKMVSLILLMLLVNINGRTFSDFIFYYVII